ncbi:MULTISPECIES: histone deacetylase family protein [unclassified Wenzhouxiangella]|uniref:histone deacetylase family protein n=1 Tax=unclassified Wenzhouxiangella TaxID=2613841 RepID=UPI000E32AA47|nr:MULTISPECIES: histone deacetylase family protein [unclassified Wenzhouxiangella]RFF27044.1 histone deacetylase family protein [Wenzhouxiangella sp. 15181]RFP69416.1 histone deacetylase family protein [Wenzhouxiangella sp. 15190]
MLRILSHPDCARHQTPTEHPESPARLAAAMRSLERMNNVHFRQASPVDEATLRLVHTPHHIDYIKGLDSGGKAEAIDPDTWFGPGTLQAALLAAGAAVDAVDHVMDDRCQRAFAVVRPPGHHAESYRAMGFCIFNNIVLAAARALAAHGLERIAICDFDVHHGNGTEEIVSGNEEILFASSHQSPLFPDSGDPETTLGGNIHNATLPPGATSDAFRDVWLSQLLPRVAAFKPQLVLVSAGFDGHNADPLAQLRLKDDDYFWIGQELRKIADTHARGRLVASLEGGYDLNALERSVQAFADALV